MSQQFCKVLEGIGSVEFTCVDQTHEQVAHAGAVDSLVEERISAVQNRFLQCTFDYVVIDWCPRLLKEKRQLLEK